MMGGFWANIVNCCGSKKEPIENVTSITTDNPSTVIRDWRDGPLALKPLENDQETKENARESVAVVPTNNLSEMLNEFPKVFVSKVIVKHNPTPLVFSGSFDERPAAIKRIPKTAKYNVDQEVKLLKKIDTYSHENLIRFFCKLEDQKFNYIVTEFYQHSLEDYTKFNTLRKLISIKDILNQVTKAIDHLKDLRIVKLNLNPCDIHVVTCLRISRVKLTNFSNCDQIRSKADVDYSKDILSLGYLFYFLLTNGEILQKQETKKMFKNLELLYTKLKTSDEALCATLMTNILNISITSNDQQPTAKEILKHPYFWNAQETLNFILEVYKRIESNENDELWQTVMKGSHDVIGVEGDWQLRIEEEVLQELAAIRKTQMLRSSNENLTENKKVNIIHLIRTIRNLVTTQPTLEEVQLINFIKFQNSHPRKSPALVKYMGTTPEELRNYWLHKFPHLITHLYSAVNMI
ncbi:unnamed protein product [Diamesa tonsa]